MKILKNRLFIFILGGIIFSSITAFAVTTISADKITYTGKNNVERSVDKVLDDLYTTANDLINRSSDLTGALSDIKLGTVTISENTHSTIYAVLFSYSSLGESYVSKRTSIKSVTGASYERLFYKYLSSSSYGISIYKLTNCESTVTVTGDVASDNGAGNIILIY